MDDRPMMTPWTKENLADRISAATDTYQGGIDMARAQRWYGVASSALKRQHKRTTS